MSDVSAEHTPHRSAGERLESWQKRNGFIAGIVLSALLISSVITIVTAGAKAFDHFHRPDWRKAESNTIQKLRSGYTVATFEAVLGAPLYERSARTGPLIENTFRRRGYWVQAVAKQNTVVFFAITVCDPTFKPAFEVPRPDTLVSGETRQAAIIELEHDSMFAARRAGGVDHYYNVSLATANSLFYDYRYFGLNAAYRTYGWGLNNLCGQWDADSTLRSKLLKFASPNTFRHGDSKEIQSIQRLLTVNTYFESTGLQDLRSIVNAFQLGPDRILIRGVG